MIVCSCKKQPIDSEYLLERDNKTSSSETIRSDSDSNEVVIEFDTKADIIYAKEGLPDLGFDSLYGEISCMRPENGKVLNEKCASIRTSSDKPLPQYYLGMNLQYNPSGFKVYRNPSEPELAVFEFYHNNKLYRIYSKRGFSNAVIDTSVYHHRHNMGMLYYRIKFDGQPLNTDAINGCHLSNGPIKDTIIRIYGCGSVANYNNKAVTFQLAYSNYEHFEIEGQRFLIHKYARMYYYCQP